MNEITYILSPIFIGLFLILIIPKFRSLTELSKSIAPTFFLAVALHFALFANLLSSELWNNVVKANAAISHEVSGLASMLRVAEASLGVCSVQIQDSVKFYREQVVDKEFTDEVNMHELETESNKTFPLSKLYRLLVIDPDFIPNPTMKSLFTDSLEQVRASRYERLELKRSHISKVKFGVLYTFGFLTLLAIAVYHSASRPAMIFTTILFSVCFSITLLVMVVLDMPYRFPYLITPWAFQHVG
jgi:hypothetical protein